MTDHLRYDPQPFFSKTFDTALGRAIWDFLRMPCNLVRMETATYLGHPVLEPLSPELEKRFGAPAFEDSEKQPNPEKQMIGHMIRQIMESRGFRLDQSNVTITTAGNVFKNGSTYVASS